MTPFVTYLQANRAETIMPERLATPGSCAVECCTGDPTSGDQEQDMCRVVNLTPIGQHGRCPEHVKLRTRAFEARFTHLRKLLKIEAHPAELFTRRQSAGTF